ncbi:hypothetical protein CBM2621_A150276 [Cupriavidus taiwanensis]|nr:hypothetical protein CBM2622_A150275 [Cupriavidus taiwanensis]SOZ84028.1 hypothetical protein CBM2621_A150276 [Cupriavidus taiwanensis]
MTLSPGLTWVTPSPTALTTPASSEPGVNGRSGLAWYLFWMISTSGKLTAAALTSMTTSPLPGTRSGRVSRVSESGGPQALHSTAFILSPVVWLACRASQAYAGRRGKCSARIARSFCFMLKPWRRSFAACIPRRGRPR